MRRREESFRSSKLKSSSKKFLFFFRFRFPPAAQLSKSIHLHLPPAPCPRPIVSPSLKPQAQAQEPKPMAATQAAQTLFITSARFAVVGASKDENKFGTKVLRWYLERNKPVTPIHPVSLHSSVLRSPCPLSLVLCPCARVGLTSIACMHARRKKTSCKASRPFLRWPTCHPRRRRL